MRIRHWQTFRHWWTGDKRSIIGEAIYEKSFKDVKLSGGARHYQMRTENEYKGSNPTTSKMDQAQTSAFFEVQGKVKKFSYAGSVGMTRAWFKESDEDHAYYTFTPTVRLSYNLKKMRVSCAIGSILVPPYLHSVR